MTERQTKLLESIMRVLPRRADLAALALAGSHANGEGLEDEYSDIDMVILSDTPDFYYDNSDWLEELGPVLATFTEEFPGARHRARRVLFTDGQDADFLLMDREVLAKSPESLPIARQVCSRGLKILYDRGGMAEAFEVLRIPPAPSPAFSQGELINLTGDFLFHLAWARKKLARGELFVAARCVDSYLQSRLLRVVQALVKLRDPSVDTRYDGRFFERWAPPEILAEFPGLMARYDAGEVAAALDWIGPLFERTVREIAELSGFPSVLPPKRPDL